MFLSQHTMMESASLEEKNVMKYVINPFRLKKLNKASTDTTTKGARNLLRLEK